MCVARAARGGSTEPKPDPNGPVNVIATLSKPAIDRLGTLQSSRSPRLQARKRHSKRIAHRISRKSRAASFKRLYPK
jgi:hypothetical protein